MPSTEFRSPFISREMTLAEIRTCFDSMLESMRLLMRKGRTMNQASTDITLASVHQTMLQRGLL